MTTELPTIALVHGPFTESSSWNAVIDRLLHHDTPLVSAHHRHFADIVAIANPLRRLHSDAAYVQEVVEGLGGPVVLVGHSYGGSVITQAAVGCEAVVGLVYVGGYAPDHGESAAQLSTSYPGSTLAGSLLAHLIAHHGEELTVRAEHYRRQLADDLDVSDVALMATTQRPVTRAALTDGLPALQPAWRHLPTRFVFGGRDRVIPAESHRRMARRARANDIVEITDASHFVMLSHPTAVATSILDAAAHQHLDAAS